MTIIVSTKEYQEFLEHYSWQLLQSPDYRLGQAFLNYFPRISMAMQQHPNEVIQQHEVTLYYTTENKEAQQIIDMYRILG